MCLVTSHTVFGPFTKMAIKLQQIVGLAAEDMKLNVGMAVQRLKVLGIVEVIDASLLDDADIRSVAEGNDTLHRALVFIREASSTYKYGWARGKALDLRPLPKEPELKQRPATMGVKHTKKSSANVKTAFASFTRRNALGKSPSHSKKAQSMSQSIQDKKTNDMRKAMLRVHSIFLKFAHVSPRLLTVRNGHVDMKEMQLQVYRSGSKSPVVVAQRARATESFFLVIGTYG